jgi:hypothetical protein
LPTADGCIKMSRVRRQTFVARVEQATGQASAGVLPAQPVLTIAKLAHGGYPRALQAASNRFSETSVQPRSGLANRNEPAQPFDDK